MSTCNADVARFQVRHDLLGTAVHGVQDGVGHRQLALATSGASTIQVGEHVRRAADAAVVLAHAPAEPHPAVATAQHQNHVVRARTRRVEPLPLAVFGRRRRG